MKKRLFLFVIFTSVVFFNINAQKTAKDTILLPTFMESIARDSFLLLGIESDFDEMLRQKKKKKWQTAKLFFRDKDGKEQIVEAEIRPGGISRQEICEWPPIKIKVSPKYLETAGLRPSGNLEIIVSCREFEEYRQLVLLEYAAYKIYNLLTDISLHTQLTKIKLLDSKKTGRLKLEDSFAFIVEHPTEMSYRLGAKLLEPRKNTRPNTLEHLDFDIACMFEFMIGNTDWYPYNNHNIDFITLPPKSRLVPLIYDFDGSGLVNAPYASPHHTLPIKTVRERYFMGLCRNEAETAATLQHFRDKKGAIIGFIETFPHFSKSSRKYALNYLNDFFEIIEDPKKTQKEILNDCGKWFKT
jgi:hypothetical protein